MIRAMRALTRSRCFFLETFNRRSTQNDAEQNRWMRAAGVFRNLLGAAEGALIRAAAFNSTVVRLVFGHG